MLMSKNTYNFDWNDDDKELFKECKSMFENDIVTRHIGMPESPWDNVKPDDLLSWDNILNNIKGGISIDKEPVIKLDMHYPTITGHGLCMSVPIDITIGKFYNKLFERICEVGYDSLDEIIIKATYPDGDEETTMNIRFKYVVRCDHNKCVIWCKSIFTNIDNECEIVVYYNNKSDKGFYYTRDDKSGLIEKHTLGLFSEVFELIRGDVSVNNLCDDNNNTSSDSSIDTLKLMHNLVATKLLLFVPVGVKIVNDEHNSEYTSTISLPKIPFSKNPGNDKCISLTIKSTIIGGMYVVTVTDNVKSESVEIFWYCDNGGMLSTDFKRHNIDENSTSILNRFYKNFMNMGIHNEEECCE